MGVPAPSGLQLPVAKKLFKLVHHYQEVDALVQLRLLVDVDQPQLTHAQAGFDDLGQRQACRRMLTKQHAVLCQGASHRPDRITAGTELRHAPRGACPGHQALAQGWPQSAIDERRFATARGADDGQKARVGQLVDHRIDLVLPAEKQVLLILPERPQARKGIGLNAGRCDVHAGLPAAFTARMKPAIAAASKPANPSIRPGSSISIRSSLSLVLGSAR